MTNLDDWLTVPQVAALRAYPASGIRKAIRLGLLPAKRAGWQYLVHRVDAMAWRPRPNGRPNSNLGSK